MIGEARFLLLRLPRRWRRSINRASLAKLGVPRSGFAVTITKDMWNEPDFDLAKHIAPEAKAAIEYQDRQTFGTDDLWEPWSNLRAHRGVAWRANEYGDGDNGMVEFVFERDTINPTMGLGDGDYTTAEHLAGFIVNRWGLL